MAASASGELLPPFVVYKAKYRYEEWEDCRKQNLRFNLLPPNSTHYTDLWKLRTWTNEEALEKATNGEWNKGASPEIRLPHTLTADVYSNGGNPEAVLQRLLRRIPRPLENVPK
ncbi:hypothetical protein HHI36_017488 [Cryptolaemus montrouzieri]|uniref:Uncharacterized protein n=1 Tax=Cryptolaemus montrouzieri TaxID=559131 RepID=A0ABD2NMQ1_9CUCU